MGEELMLLLSCAYCGGRAEEARCYAEATLAKDGRDVRAAAVLLLSTAISPPADISSNVPSTAHIDAFKLLPAQALAAVARGITAASSSAAMTQQVSALDSAMVGWKAIMSASAAAGGWPQIQDWATSVED